jgi:acyl-CoA reductase-like NAD-dependent aldehyde dehydrogenase
LCFRALAENVEHLLTTHKNDIKILHAGTIDKEYSLVEPIVVEALRPTSPIVLSEKYAPLFPLVRATREEMPHLINLSEYSLGATIFGDANLIPSLMFPHIAHNASILEIEDEDAHVPFGGYKNSGFISFHGQLTQGPILYSVETTIK